MMISRKTCNTRQYLSVSKEEYPPLDNYPQGGSFTLYIHVTDINGLYEKVKGKAKIAKEMHTL